MRKSNVLFVNSSAESQRYSTPSKLLDLTSHETLVPRLSLLVGVIGLKYLSGWLRKLPRNHRPCLHQGRQNLSIEKSVSTSISNKFGIFHQRSMVLISSSSRRWMNLPTSSRDSDLFSVDDTDHSIITSNEEMLRGRIEIVGGERNWPYWTMSAQI